jgi:Carboxypeptidase regulatory-like domain/TonB-dependent Receptor Plug Domain
MKRVLCLMLVLLIGAFAPRAHAQISGGNIYGTVTDQSGAVLPGVDVSLASVSIGGQPRTTVTDSQGQFRFLNLDAGTYKVSTNLSGFTKMEREVIVTTGVNATLTFPMSVKSLEETVTVTAETPVVDVKKIGTLTTLTQGELQSTPQSKDPWALLKTVPGVTVDRVNVGGNESGQQSGFVGKGSLATDTMWNLDGVVITDTTSGGASSMYFDFDAFDEVAVNTGGNDLKVQTGGIGINFVTRRGTNAFKGSAKFSIDNSSMESSNLPDALKGDPRLLGADKATHTDSIKDWGFDIGGPIIKDRLWFWGSYGDNDIKIIRLNQTGDETILKNTNVKVNAAATKNDQLSFFYFNGAKEKLGRSPGQAGTEDDSFLWNQGNFYPLDGFLKPIHGLAKVEDNHTFGSNLFINAKYAWFGWGYGFAPRGGADKDGGINFDTDHAYGSWSTYTARKPWHIVDVSGSAFKSAAGGNHEFKFGFGYRRNPNHSTTRWSGSEVVAHVNPGNDNFALAYRARVVNFVGQNYDAFVGDTYSRGRLTVNGGLRWDRQNAENLASVAPANTMFPDLLPSLSFAGGGPSISWNDVSPRIGATVALDEGRKTVARTSYASYAGQLNPFEVTSASPVGGYYTFIAYKWVDTNHDGFAQKNEILTNLGPQYANAVDPAKPTSISSPNTIAPDYHANRDHEFILGLDREVIPNLAVGAAYTFRRTNDWPTWDPRIGMTSADYTVVDRPSGAGYSAVVYAPNSAKIDATGGGRILENRPDYHSTYQGLEFTVNKRLSNRWQTRVAFSINDWREYVDGPDAFQNPTHTDSTTGGAGTGTLSGSFIDGGQIAPRSGGSGKGDIFFNARWQFNANGFYQLPGGFDIGANIFGRQGYVQPLIFQTSAGGDGSVRALATPTLDAVRYPNLWDIDLRLAKTITITRVKFLLSADLFNVLNAGTTLAQNRNLSSGAFGTINDIISPRIARIGVKFQF